MASRKTRTEAERLKAQAEDLLHEQQQVLAHAGDVVRAASRELGRVTSQEVVPRLVSGTRQASKSARDKIVDEVLPSVAAVIGSTISVIEHARDERFKQLSGKVNALAHHKVVPTPAPKGSGAGKYIAIGIGIAAVLGAGYVLWQTFRADDELWVSEED